MRTRAPGWMVVVFLAGAVVGTVAGARAGESRTTMQAARLRAGAGVVHPILQKVDEGTKLTVVEDGKRWIKVKLSGGDVGWVSSRVFDKPAPPRGYGKVLTEHGLQGASSTVVTMAARGLTPSAQAGTGADAVLYEFFDRTPAGPAALASLLAELDADDSCPALQGTLDVADRQLAGSPGRDDLEVRLGKAAAVRLLRDRSLVTDPDLDSYLNQVGMAVAERSGRYDLPWRFVLFEDDRPAVLALPGGVVMVASGLLPRLSDESELAGVMGQAIAHVSLGHGAAEAEATLAGSAGRNQNRPQRFNRLVGIVGRLAGASYQEREELDADALGMALAACAGYDPGGLARAYRAAPVLAGQRAPAAEAREQYLESIRRQAGFRDGKRFAARYRARLAGWKR